MSSVLLAAALALSGPASSAGTKTHYDIPAQALATALRSLADTGDLQLVFSPEVVAGLQTRGLKGEYTVLEALDLLISNSGLTYSFDGKDTVVVRRLNSAAAESAVRLAQVQQRSPDSPAEPSGSKEIVSEILVTATKRTENVQDVPLSIAVVTADDIDRRGLVGAADYLRGIPGVNQFDGGFGQSIIVRGIETQMFSQNYQSGPTTATYFGETPTTNSAGLTATNVDIKLVDIERVEVLRGPQGTAFGSSSMGGAVRTIPVAPKLGRYEGRLSSGYSLTSGTGGSNYTFQAVGNLPLIRDKLAIRAAAYAFSDEGFYRNRAGSDPAFRTAVVDRYGVQAFATDEDHVGTYRVNGGRVSALFQATEDLRFTVTYLTQKSETDGYSVATSGTYEQAILRVAPEHVRRGQTGALFDTHIDIANATVEYDLGWAELLATYSYLDGGSTFAFPWTALNTNNPYPVSYLGPAGHRENVGELRLATKLDGAWNFLAGLYAEDQDDTYGVINYYWYGSPATNIFAPGARFLGTYLEQRGQRQKAAFGEVSWAFLPHWTLTGGVRAYEYDRHILTDSAGPLFGGTSSTRVASDASGATFRANLSYKPRDNTLVYANWAQGFRIGKPQAMLNPVLCDPNNDGIIDGTNVPIESTRSLDSDSVESYELGGKFAAFGRRLTIDAAVFRMDWSDIPVMVRPPCLASYLANAGAARSEGVELQANFYVTEAVRVDVGGSWMNARLTQDVPAQGFSAGDRLPGTPRINANLGVQYAFEIAGHSAFVRADAIEVGDFYGEMLQRPTTRAGDYIKLDASARVSIEKLNVDLYVRNLTNEDAFTFHGYLPKSDFYGYRLRPRTIGIQLGYDF